MVSTFRLADVGDREREREGPRFSHWRLGTLMHFHSRDLDSSFVALLSQLKLLL